MHTCRGNGTIKFVLKKVPIETAFSKNYRSGIEELEDALVEMVLSFLPAEFKAEVEDVVIEDYQLLDKEVERED
jgi:hypothetical protein